MSLDPFRATRAEEVGERFRSIRDAHQIQEEKHWFGSLVIEFDYFELEILKDMGFLSIRDMGFLKQHEKKFAVDTSQEGSAS